MKLNPIILIVFIGFLTYPKISASSTTGAPYGASCYFTSDCDRAAELHCFQGHCTCGRPAAMMYDESQGKCVSKAGQVCYYWTLRHWTETWNLRQKSFRLGQASQPSPAKPDCVPHADCTKEGRCVCENGYYKTDNGLCHAIAGYLDPCSHNGQCQAGSTCLQGRCQCDPVNSLYEIVSKPATRESGDPLPSLPGHCVGKAGAPCIDGHCTDRASCEGSICECQPGSIGTVKGHCKNLYSHPCDSSDDCIPQLYCKGRRCSCKFADQLYDTKRRQCLSRVGEPCSPTHSNCIQGAMCAPIEEGGPSHCACVPGFVENVEGDCKVSFYGVCNASSDCNAVASLVCLNGRCQCGDFAKYNPSHGKCVGLVGAKCFGLREKECIENARCKQIHPRLPGHCACVKGHFEDTNYACIPSYHPADHSDQS